MWSVSWIFLLLLKFSHVKISFSALDSYWIELIGFIIYTYSPPLIQETSNYPPIKLFINTFSLGIHSKMQYGQTRCTKALIAKLIIILILRRNISTTTSQLVKNNFHNSEKLAKYFSDPCLFWPKTFLLKCDARELSRNLFLLRWKALELSRNPLLLRWKALLLSIVRWERLLYMYLIGHPAKAQARKINLNIPFLIWRWMAKDIKTLNQYEHLRYPKLIMWILKNNVANTHCNYYKYSLGMINETTIIKSRPPRRITRPPRGLGSSYPPEEASNDVLVGSIYKEKHSLSSKQE